MYYGAYTCLMELILMIHSLFLYFGSCTCIMKHILVLRNLFLYFGYRSTRRYYRTNTEVPVGTFESLPYSFLYSYSLFRVLSYNCLITEVPVGTIGLILILQNLYLYYRYGSTRRYYRDFTCTKVPIGTTEQIQRYP